MRKYTTRLRLTSTIISCTFAAAGKRMSGYDIRSAAPSSRFVLPTPINLLRATTPLVSYIIHRPQFYYCCRFSTHTHTHVVYTQFSPRDIFQFLFFSRSPARSSLSIYTTLSCIPTVLRRATLMQTTQLSRRQRFPRGRPKDQTKSCRVASLSAAAVSRLFDSVYLYKRKFLRFGRYTLNPPTLQPTDKQTTFIIIRSNQCANHNIIICTHAVFAQRGTHRAKSCKHLSNPTSFSPIIRIKLSRTRPHRYSSSRILISHPFKGVKQ